MYQAEWMLKGRVRLSANFTTGAPESAQPPAPDNKHLSLPLKQNYLRPPDTHPERCIHTHAHTHTHTHTVPPDPRVLWAWTNWKITLIHKEIKYFGQSPKAWIRTTLDSYLALSHTKRFPYKHSMSNYPKHISVCATTYSLPVWRPKEN